MMLFPDPDSPTIDKVSPLEMPKEIFDAAKILSLRLVLK